MKRFGGGGGNLWRYNFILINLCTKWGDWSVSRLENFTHVERI